MFDGLGFPVMGEHFCVDIGSAEGGSVSSSELGPVSEQQTSHCCRACLQQQPTVSSSASAAHSATWDCRICQEEDDVANLETPCACSGSLKFAHRRCIQRWCDQKGDTKCEICHQLYRSGYSAPQQQPQSESLSVDLSGIPSAHPMELRDPRILAIAAAQRQLLELEYEEQPTMNSASAACCRSAALILMALLLLRHALDMVATRSDEDASTLVMMFLLRAVGFLVPCYMMADAMNMLQRRQQHQVDS